MFGRKKTDDLGQLSPTDAQMLHVFKGSSFDFNAQVTLPSGRTISGDEMSVLVAALPDEPELAVLHERVDETPHERAVREERKRRRAEEAQRDREYEQAKNAKEAIMRSLRVADVSDYAAWLEGFLRNGGDFTHFYDYDFRPGRMYVATESVVIPALYGALSVDVIVPSKFTVVASGHCSLYFMQGFQKDTLTVPSFNNLPRYLHSQRKG